MSQVQDFRWLDSQEANTHWLSLLNSPTTSAATHLKRLRSLLPANRAALLLEQYELHSLSRRKVSNPNDWFWTRQLLEQSSDEETATESAFDFPQGSIVQDICCGAGADSIAMAKRGYRVNAYDRCGIACQLTRRNATAHNVSIEVTEESAEAILIDPESYIHIDPDRRPEGRRTSSLEFLSPGWPIIHGLLKQSLGMSLKLAPGMRVDFNRLRSQDLLDQTPESIRFLSKDGTVRQQRWYWGIERWPSHSITASMSLNEPAMRRANQFSADQITSCSRNAYSQGDWFHESFSDLEQQRAKMDRSIVQDSLRGFIADYDPSIRAAELAPPFASRYGWHLIGLESGYLTANEPVIHPLVRWFEVIESLPLDRKQLKAFARSAKPRSWELKSRSIDVDLEAIRKSLDVDLGSESRLAVLFTKVGEHHRAIVCQEVNDKTVAK